MKNFTSSCVLALAVLGFVSCGERIENVTGLYGLTQADGQCIKVIYPSLIFRGAADIDTDLLIVVPEGAISKRKNGEEFSAGTEFVIAEFQLIHAIDNTYLMVNGRLRASPEKFRRISLLPLVEPDWFGAALRKIEKGESVLLPGMTVPLNRRVAGSCIEGGVRAEAANGVSISR